MAWELKLGDALSETDGMNEHALWADLREVVEVKEAVLVESSSARSYDRPRSLRALAQATVAAVAAPGCSCKTGSTSVRADSNFAHLCTSIGTMYICVQV